MFGSVYVNISICNLYYYMMGRFTEQSCDSIEPFASCDWITLHCVMDHLSNMWSNCKILQLPDEF